MHATNYVTQVPAKFGERTLALGKWADRSGVGLSIGVTQT